MVVIPDQNTWPGRTDTDGLRQRLLNWFAEHGRDLPWRHTRDPYRVLVSEIMLQQTQVDRVIPKYLAFLEQFPDMAALADAPTADVIRAWAGLGYNRRAVNLQRTARAVLGEHGGQFPRDVAVLLTLPGIGPYTAGALACFAFEQDVGFVDTNIRRVVQRLFVGPEECGVAVESELVRLAAQAVPAAGLGLESGDHGAWRACLHRRDTRLLALPAPARLRRLYHAPPERRATFRWYPDGG